MKAIIGYIKRYFYETDKRVLALVTLFIALLIYFNYHYLIDDRISHADSFYTSFIGRSCVFFLAFAIPYVLYVIFNKRNYFRQPKFIALLLIAPAIFSFKIALDIPIHFSNDFWVNEYWNHVFYWPVLCIITSALIIACWLFFRDDEPLYGLTTKNLIWTPYWLMLVIMLPLIAAASTQPDFLAMYPKLNAVVERTDMHITWWHKVLFELAYGTDFITIEFFFRGFIVLAFVKWAGKDAILPMACFYCTIHFGKPLGECISSYFGGILLGIVVYHTRSIFGGLMVHLGIAWLMELGGYLGHSY
ncbi:MAG TPA: CPBP family glutamic-type intramembrane protease [Chitinophagaceae bacterium]|jgi:hypothetical protein|nr:CPBP family glutamic-type intramembrane protease [Chitinophagaceae bacterium]